MKPNAQLAPNQQAERSLDEQTIVVPADIRQAAIQSPAILALCRLEGGGLIEELAHAMLEVAGAPTGTKSLRFWFTLRHLEEIIDTLFAEEVNFLRGAFENIAPIYSGVAPEAPKPLSLGL